MAKVLVAGAILKCAHGGQAPLSGGGGATAGGAAILASGAEVAKTFAGCTMTAGGAPTPCVSQAAIAGVSAKLTVGGVGVLLDSASGPTSNGTPWSVQTAGQSLLESDG
jgi:hypothetical protein